MNEHLKELMIKAGYAAPEIASRANVLVELLINESIEVMVKHDYHGTWLGEKIKEHFGIEE